MTPKSIPVSPFPRRRTREVRVGSVRIGQDAPISIQSMTTTRTREVEATVAQITSLQVAGCEIIRVAVFDPDDASSLGEIKARIAIPLVADIHFDHRLALQALAQGVDGLRINPGNIGSTEKVAQVVERARERGVPIRIGVNAGSLEKDLLQRYGGPTPEAMVESALRHVRILEDLNYPNLKVSLKSSDPMRTIEANRLFSRTTDYPVHLGVTEAGPPVTGAARSAAALGVLLSEGIGDTLRVSLTADPAQEIAAGLAILQALGLRTPRLRVVSCPTCGRCRTPSLIDLAGRIERRLSSITRPLTVAVMGCAVNGPGEAKEADVGVACGDRQGVLFARGVQLRVVPEGEIESALIEEVLKILKETPSDA